MCVVCNNYPLLLQRQVIHSEYHYTNLSIRSIGIKMIFTAEHFSITRDNDRYWSDAGLHICGSCLERRIVDNKIQWMATDYKDTSVLHSLNGKMVNIGNELLNKVNNLKVFI